MSRDIRSSAPPGGLTPLNPSFPSGPITQRICLRRKRNLSYNPSNLRPGEPTRGFEAKNNPFLPALRETNRTLFMAQIRVFRQ